jgi:hypothetical protein
MAPETLIELAPLTVRLFPDKWPLTTLTLMSALPPLIVMVFPLRLQLEPDVPVWPVVLNVKTCPKALEIGRNIRIANFKEFLIL